jgi:MFS family permease
VRQTPELLAPLLMMTLVGVFAWEFQVTLPLFAKFTFGGGAGAYGALATFLGIGSIAGALIIAHRGQASGRSLVWTTFGFGIALLAAAVSPTLPFALVVMVPLGTLSLACVTICNSNLQLTTRPEMRGRVMALWFAAVVGSTPIGAPIVGWIADSFGARYSLAIGGVAALLAGLIGYPTLVRRQRRDASEESLAPDTVSDPAPIVAG